MLFRLEYKLMIKKGIMAIGLLAALHTYAQDVTPYAPGIMEEGVVYYLPKTQIEIQVTATKVTYTPGELCQYANRYLRLNNVSSKPSEHWEIKDVHVYTIGVPDPGKAYSIKLKDKSVASQVELTEDGIIKAINTTYPNKKTVAPKGETPQAKRVDPRSFMTEEILLAGSSNKMAELIAREIYNIRESKNSLTRGQADYMPQDGAALKIMLDNLNTQEKAMTEMFSGWTERTNHTFTFHVMPTEEIQDQPVFRFSKKLGVLNVNDLAGEPIYITVTDETTIPPVSEEAKSKKKIEGVIYNIPGKARVSIESFEKSYYEEELIIAQFGETEVLIDNLFNKKVNTRVVFDPITGGIVKIDKD